MDDSDIAKAAIRGVANPAIATVTAITLQNVAIRKFSVMRFCDALANGIKPTSWSRFSPKTQYPRASAPLTLTLSMVCR